MVALCCYVYFHYFQYVLFVGLSIGAAFVLTVFYKLFRKYGSLLFGGVPYAMDGQNIVDYANKYFPHDTWIVKHLAAVWGHGTDRDKILKNIEAHLEYIRDALFNTANPAYAMVDFSLLPMPVKQALLPDMLGLYSKTFRYKLDVRSTAQSAFEDDEVCIAFNCVGGGPVLDDWHRRRWEINAIMDYNMRCSVRKEGAGVWLFEMGAPFVSPYDDYWRDEGFNPLGGRDDSWDKLKEVAEAVEKRFAGPPVEEFIAPPPSLLFREESAEHGGHLWRDYIFLGTNIRDGKPYWKKLADFQHHLIVGISGYGKSVFLNQVLQGVRYNADRFEKVYLVDLKGGVELVEYEDYGEQFQVFFRYEELHQLVQGLVDLMNARLDAMREKRVKKWTGKRILFMVDEFAQIALQSPETKEEKAAHARLLSNLNKLSMLGRGAGVLLWIQLQKATTDVMDSSFRNNLQAQVCFRVANRLAAAMLFGEAKDLEIDPTRLRRGQCIYYDDATGETVYLQGHMRNEQEAAA